MPYHDCYGRGGDLSSLTSRKNLLVGLGVLVIAGGACVIICIVGCAVRFAGQKAQVEQSMRAVPLGARPAHLQDGARSQTAKPPASPRLGGASSPVRGDAPQNRASLTGTSRAPSLPRGTASLRQGRVDSDAALTRQRQARSDEMASLDIHYINLNEQEEHDFKMQLAAQAAKDDLIRRKNLAAAQNAADIAATQIGDVSDCAPVWTKAIEDAKGRADKTIEQIKEAAVVNSTIVIYGPAKQFNFCTCGFSNTTADKVSRKDAHNNVSQNDPDDILLFRVRRIIEKGKREYLELMVPADVPRRWYKRSPYFWIYLEQRAFAGVTAVINPVGAPLHKLIATLKSQHEIVASQLEAVFPLTAIDDVEVTPDGEALGRHQEDAGHVVGSGDEEEEEEPENQRTEEPPVTHPALPDAEVGRPSASTNSPRGRLAASSDVGGDLVGEELLWACGPGGTPAADAGVGFRPDAGMDSDALATIIERKYWRGSSGGSPPESGRELAADGDTVRPTGDRDPQGLRPSLLPEESVPPSPLPEGSLPPLAPPQESVPLTALRTDPVGGSMETTREPAAEALQSISFPELVGDDGGAPPMHSAQRMQMLHPRNGPRQGEVERYEIEIRMRRPDVSADEQVPGV